MLQGVSFRLRGSLQGRAFLRALRAVRDATGGERRDVELLGDDGASLKGGGHGGAKEAGHESGGELHFEGV